MIHCDHLTGHDLARNGVIKVVRKDLGAKRTRLYGCERPDGPVIALSKVLFEHRRERGDEIHDVWADVEAVRGPTVMLTQFDSTGTGDGYEDHDDAWRVVNLRTGSSYAFWTYRNDSALEESSEYDLGVPKVKLLDGRGGLAVSYNDTDTKRSFIAVFDPRGKRTVLDRGPEAQVATRSLTLEGRRLTWRSGGVERSAQMPS